MFGYVRPYKEELKVRQLRDYESAYCGLCHTIGRRHGFVPRMFLNYDFVFLAMLLSPEQDKPVLASCRCPARLWCKRKPCALCAGLDTAADESTILSYWKLRDTVADGSFWTRLGARILSLLLRRGYRKAAALRPEFDRSVNQCLSELRALEEENSPSLDRTADTFARILRAAAPRSGDEVRDRALGELLYHVGRWIYLVDAWDDLEEDKKSGAYNPVAARFPGAQAENRDYLRTTLCHSHNLACAAFGLMDMGYWGETVGNILYMGIPTAEELVFSGQWQAATGLRRQDRKKLASIRRTDT